MGQKGRSIVKMDADKIINLLSKALSDKWLAYYLYKKNQTSAIFPCLHGWIFVPLILPK